MKIEDAIQRQEFLKNTYINCINGIDEHKGYYQKLVDSCDMAIKAFEKQIPKDAIKTLGHQNILEWHCPICHEEIAPNVKRCNCGQALNWPE